MGINEKAWHVGFKWTIGNEDVPTGAICVDNYSKQLHICDIEDAGTDWALAVRSHPTLCIHSATDPASDYIRIYHDGTDAYFDAVTTTAINFLVAETSIVEITAGGLQVNSTYGLYLRDTGVYIYSPDDGKIAIVADGTGVDDVSIFGTFYLYNPATIIGDYAFYFRNTASYIYSPDANKLALVANGTGVDDISLFGTLYCYDNITISGDYRLNFRDTGVYIHSGDDGKIAIYADGTGVDDIALFGTLYCYDSTTISGDYKAYFRDTTSYIYSPGAGKLAIVADATAVDDISLMGTLYCYGNATISGALYLYFRDTGAYIRSRVDGNLDIYSDGTSAAAINLAAGTGGIIQMANAVYFVKGFSTVGFITLWNTGTVSSTEGDIWYDTATNTIHYWDGSSEKTVATA